MLFLTSRPDFCGVCMSWVFSCWNSMMTLCLSWLGLSQHHIQPEHCKLPVRGKGVGLEGVYNPFWSKLFCHSMEFLSFGGVGMLKVISAMWWSTCKDFSKSRNKHGNKNMQINTAKCGSKASADEDFVTPHMAWPPANKRMFGGKMHWNPAESSLWEFSGHQVMSHVHPVFNSERVASWCQTFPPTFQHCLLPHKDSLNTRPH